MHPLHPLPQGIAPGMLIAPYRSYAMSEHTYLQLLKSLPSDWGKTCIAATREHEWVELLHR